MNGKVVPKGWNFLARELAEEGWCCNYARIDADGATLFVLAAHRDEIHRMISSDNLGSALEELFFQTLPSP